MKYYADNNAKSVAFANRQNVEASHDRKRKIATPLIAITAAALIGSQACWSEQQSDLDILDLQLEELLNVEVTSASKKREDLNTVASAIYVISNTDIRRAGVTNVPDALRMVPGVQVARIDSNKWAVTARSLNGRFANKLLVMIDGRTVYTPTYAGVYWEMQNVRLEDIARIEVTRGPGGSVWGANAVNGVINIITQHAADTQGGEVTIGAGDYEKAILSARYGTKLADNGYTRAYVNANSRGEFIRDDQTAGNDSWETYQLGLRMDKQLSGMDSLTISADYGNGNIDQDSPHASYTAPYQIVDSSGVDYSAWNLLARWDHTFSENSDWTLQFYYDHLDRKTFTLDEVRDTYDIDFTHRLQFHRQHELLWGLGYRFMDDRINSGDVVSVFPQTRDDNLFSAFIQDELKITDDFSVTLGAKWEHNEYTQEEFQPSLKMSWKATNSTHLWASVAKAVRTPTITELQSEVLGLVIAPTCEAPPAASCPGNSDLPFAIVTQSASELPPEELIAYEAGLRSTLSPTLSLDLAVFRNEYSQLRTFAFLEQEPLTEPHPHLRGAIGVANTLGGDTQGLELASKWLPSDDLMFSLAYTYTDTDIEWPTFIDVQQNTSAPRHQLSLQANYQLSAQIETNLWLRYVDKTPVVALEVYELDPYMTLDFNIAWQVLPTVELRLVGQNLLDSSHPEYVDIFLMFPAEVERSIYGKVTVRF